MQQTRQGSCHAVKACDQRENVSSTPFYALFTLCSQLRESLTYLARNASEDIAGREEERTHNDVRAKEGKPQGHCKTLTTVPATSARLQKIICGVRFFTKRRSRIKHWPFRTHCTAHFDAFVSLKMALRAHLRPLQMRLLKAPYTSQYSNARVRPNVCDKCEPKGRPTSVKVVKKATASLKARKRTN